MICVLHKNSKDRQLLLTVFGLCVNRGNESCGIDKKRTAPYATAWVPKLLQSPVFA